MKQIVYIVLVSSEVAYYGEETNVIAVKSTREAAEQIVAERKQYINKIWKNKTLKVDEDVPGVFSCYDNDGSSYAVCVSEHEVED